MQYVAGETGGVVTDGSFSEASGVALTVATPTAVLATDQPTTLSVPLVRPSPTIPSLYHQAHTSDIPSISSL